MFKCPGHFFSPPCVTREGNPVTLSAPGPLDPSRHEAGSPSFLAPHASSVCPGGAPAGLCRLPFHHPDDLPSTYTQSSRSGAPIISESQGSLFSSLLPQTLLLSDSHQLSGLQSRHSSWLRIRATCELTLLVSHEIGTLGGGIRASVALGAPSCDSSTK